MQKRILLFFLVFSLFLCGCSHNVHPADSASAAEELPVPQNDGFAGTFIEVREPDGDFHVGDSNSSAQSSAKETDSSEDSQSASSDGSSDSAPAEEDQEQADDDQSAQVPIYPADEDQHYSSNHTTDGIEDPADNTDAGDEPEAAENDAAQTEPESPGEPAALPPYSVTAYTMNTVYYAETGDKILELCINTPVIDGGNSEAELFFNRYYNARTLEYALYINETVYPALKQTLPDENTIYYFATMAYSILYNTDGYLCIGITYTEDLPDRCEERTAAALFDMENAVLADEWDVSEDAEALPAAVGLRIESILAAAAGTGEQDPAGSEE